jgi:hypothetical protein
VVGGKSEIDAIVAVPEPTTWALVLLGAGTLMRGRRTED